MNQNKFSVVTVDTVSIQHYVFASNKLKENIGASYIIEELLYKQLMIEVIRTVANEPDADLAEEWRINPEEIALKNPDRRAEIGYIGGGNAMILFREEGMADDFIAGYSEAVLQYFPGIRISYGRKDGIGEAELAGRGFQKLREELNIFMVENRNLYYASPVVYKPGIVEDGASSNDAAEFSDRLRDESGNRSRRWIAGSTKAKLQAAQHAFGHIQTHYADELAGKYVLTNEVENLGQAKDKGYVAVVHADGNGIGNEFRKATDLSALRKLSRKVSDVADRVMRKLIKAVIKALEMDQRIADKEFELARFKAPANAGSEIKKLDGLPILPLRPILAAGDDITFVCEGRLGVFLAGKILEFFEEESVNGKKVTACAGVALCKTHYPFFKSYELAEELISSSKKVAKARRSKEEEIQSWLHFLPISSGFNGSLDDVLDQQFSADGRRLIAGPYALRGGYDELIKRLTHYRPTIESDSSWPLSKLMEMREMFRMDHSSRRLFIAEARARNLKFHPSFSGNLIHEGEEQPTYLFDMIQLIDFYPDMLKTS